MCATSFGLYLGHLQECQHKNHRKEGILAYVEYCTYTILIKSFQSFLLGIYPICSTPPPRVMTPQHQANWAARVYFWYYIGIL